MPDLQSAKSEKMADINGLASVDYIFAAGAGRCEKIVSAIRRARMRIREHGLTGSREHEALELRGDATVIEIASAEPDNLLLLAEVRRGTRSRIVAVVGSAPADQRVIMRSLGIDHLLTGVFDERELAAILMNAVVGEAVAAGRPRKAELDHRWQLDAGDWTLVAPMGQRIRLSRSEFAVLEALMKEAGQLVPRAHLLGLEAYQSHNLRALDVLISRIRRKVWDCAGLELPLRSARNLGYVFASPGRSLSVNGSSDLQ